MAKKILITEDEKPLAKALELKLQKEGFDAKAVFDGAEAVAELKRQKYDLMLLDLVMPNQDGFATLEAIKNAGIKLPIIVSSNLSQEEDMKRAKELGAVDYFIKSDTPLTEVVSSIKKYL